MLNGLRFFIVPSTNKIMFRHHNEKKSVRLAKFLIHEANDFIDGYA